MFEEEIMVNKNHKDDVKAKDSKKILPVVAAAVVLVCAAILIFTNGNEPNDKFIYDQPCFLLSSRSLLVLVHTTPS